MKSYHHYFHYLYSYCPRRFCHHNFPAAVEINDECATMDKCHAEAHMREVVFLIFCVHAKGNLVLDVGTDFVSVIVSVVMFGYEW